MQSLRAFLLIALACSAAAQLPSNTIVQNALLVPQLSTLVQVLSSPGYESILQALNSPGNFTVFAPVNDAFATAGLDPTDVAYVSDVLLYHVIGARVHSGDLAALQFAPSLLTDPNAVSLGGKAQNLEISRSGSTVNITFGVPGEKQTTATVVIADVECSNGVVHVVDTVLIPPARTSVVATAAGLTSLVNAVVSVNLAGVVDNTSSLTIFAPINAAFAKVGPVSPAVLTQVLEYHVVPAVAFSTDLSNGQVIPTVNGNNLKVTIEADGSVFINDARVLIPNVLTANGVVHVIDSVLLPPTTQMPRPHAHHQHHGQKPIEKITRRH